MLSTSQIRTGPSHAGRHMSKSDRPAGRSLQRRTAVGAAAEGTQRMEQGFTPGVGSELTSLAVYLLAPPVEVHLGE